MEALARLYVLHLFSQNMDDCKIQEDEEDKECTELVVSYHTKRLQEIASFAVQLEPDINLDMLPFRSPDLSGLTPDGQLEFETVCRHRKLRVPFKVEDLHFAPEQLIIQLNNESIGWISEDRQVVHVCDLHTGRSSTYVPFTGAPINSFVLPVEGKSSGIVAIVYHDTWVRRLTVFRKNIVPVQVVLPRRVGAVAVLAPHLATSKRSIALFIAERPMSDTDRLRVCVMEFDIAPTLTETSGQGDVTPFWRHTYYQLQGNTLVFGLLTERGEHLFGVRKAGCYAVFEGHRGRGCVGSLRQIIEWTSDVLYVFRQKVRRWKDVWNAH